MRWGLLVACLAISLAACRSTQTARQSEGSIIFRDVAAETGLQFHHFTGATGQFYILEIMGSGGALFDYDGDGDLDVYLIQGTTLDARVQPGAAQFPPPTGWRPGNRLFRNELKPSSRLSFTDVTGQAGLDYVGYGMGAAVGDYDGDGDPDLHLTNYGSNVLYQNNGNGTFTNVTRAAGVEVRRWSSSASFLDYDKDGDLDLYVTNYLDFALSANQVGLDATGQRTYFLSSAYRGLPDRLFRNEGNGKFTDVTEAAGIGSISGPGLGVITTDANRDGRPDIYVANDGTANFLWINKGNGTFEERALLSGAAYSADGMARAGMGLAAEDFDADGDEDILVTNLTREGSTLYRNDGRGDFEDATMEFKLHYPSFPNTGFGVGGFDYDHDGRLDLFAVNGAVTALESLRGDPYPYHQKNQLFHAEADGTFRDVSSTVGPDLQLSEVSRGAAFGDIDNDGDIDVLVINNNGPVRLLRNELSARRNWLSVRLKVGAGNRDAIGARIALFRQGAPTLWRRVHTDGSYLSASDVRAHFGLGENAAVQRIVVHWPDGLQESWDKPPLNTFLTLERGTGHPAKRSEGHFR